MYILSNVFNHSIKAGCRLGAVLFNGMWMNLGQDSGAVVSFDAHVLFLSDETADIL